MTKSKWDGAFRAIKRRSPQAVSESVGVETPFAFDAGADHSDVPDFVTANWEGLGTETESVLSLPGRDANYVRDTLITASKFFHVIECTRANVARGAMTWATVDAYHASLVGTRLIAALYGVVSYGVRGRTVLIDFRPELGAPDDRAKFRKAFKNVDEPVRILRPMPKQLDQSDAWELTIRLCNISDDRDTSGDLLDALANVSAEKISAFRNNILYDSVAWNWLDDFSPTLTPLVEQHVRLEDTGGAHSLTLRALSIIFEFSKVRLTNLCNVAGIVPSGLSPMMLLQDSPRSLLG